MHRRALGWILLSGASFAALGTPALAQDGGVVSDEIVVTATGRQAAIQDVPLAVTALGGEMLQNAGVDTLLDIEQLAPSLRIGSGQSTTAGTIARIRGIGTGGDNPGFESAVGFFIDGVYRSRAGVAISDLPELERVEVLRGPQGTLFGRNTSAGAISVITAGPEFETGAWLEGSFGDLGYASGKAGFTTGITDTFAVRLDGSVRARDGYITDHISGDDINTQNRWTARGQALWDISPNASLRVIVDAAQTDEACCGSTPLIYGPAEAANQAVVGAASVPPGRVGDLNTQFEDRRMTVSPGRDYGEAVDEWGISGEFSWDLGAVNLTSITAYRDWDATRNQDIDFNLIDIAYRDGLEIGFETFTQEIRLQGEIGRLNWLVGGFYGDEELDTTDTIRTGAHTNFFAQGIAIGNTQALVPGGCAYFNFGGGQPSLFQCLNAALLAGNPAAQGAAALAIATAPGADGGYLFPNPNGGGQQADNWNIQTESFSVFTHNEIDLTDSLVLTLGLRYNNETKNLAANLNSVAPSCTSLQAINAATVPIYGPGGIVGATQANIPGGATLMNIACNPAINSVVNGAWVTDSEENEWSGTASLAYHISEDVLLYGGYSRGYKAGGFNVDRSGFAITPATIDTTGLSVDSTGFDPEFVDAYELGLKTTLLGGSTNLNVSVFYQQIHDYQLNAFNGFNFITRNVPELISKGVEVDFLTRPTDNLMFQGGVVYNDAYYDSTVVFNPSAPGPNTVTSGDPLAFAPEWSVTGAVTYTLPLTDDLQALFYLDGRWNSEYRTQTLSRDPLGRTDQEEYAVFNGRIGLGNPNGRWAFEVWGRNLSDELIYVGAFAPPLQDGTFHIFPSEPRTWGATLRMRY